MKALYGWEDIIDYEEEKERAKALSKLDDDILILIFYTLILKTLINQ